MRQPGNLSEKVAAAGAHIRRSLSLGLQRLNARILLAHRDPQTEIFAEPVAMSWSLAADLPLCPLDPVLGEGVAGGALD